MSLNRPFSDELVGSGKVILGHLVCVRVREEYAKKNYFERFRYVYTNRTGMFTWTRFIADIIQQATYKGFSMDMERLSMIGLS